MSSLCPRDSSSGRSDLRGDSQHIQIVRESREQKGVTIKASCIRRQQPSAKQSTELGNVHQYFS